jgi:hypothetical protein
MSSGEYGVLPSPLLPNKQLQGNQTPLAGSIGETKAPSSPRREPIAVADAVEVLIIYNHQTNGG